MKSFCVVLSLVGCQLLSSIELQGTAPSGGGYLTPDRAEGCRVDSPPMAPPCAWHEQHAMRKAVAKFTLPICVAALPAPFFPTVALHESSRKQAPAAAPLLAALCRLQV